MNLHDSYRYTERRTAITGYNPPPTATEVFLDWLDYRIERAERKARRAWKSLKHLLERIFQ